MIIEKRKMREREREMLFVPIVSRVVKKSKIIATIKPKRA